MTNGQSQEELVVLVADKNMQFAVTGVLNRARALRVRDVTPTFYVHPESDPGCLLRSQDFLRPFVNRFDHALVLLDRDGCGREKFSRESLEAEIEDRLSQSGWDVRAAAVVIDPELEMWIWSNSYHVDAVLGWEGRNPSLRSWLQEEAYLSEGQIKPDRPKEAMEQALRVARKPRSSSLYQQLAQKVSLERCVDPSFLKFKTILQEWFPSK